ncbi:MAG: tetratricopeptide repeat protein [Elusimicrobiales bacterium]|nr:tetratricopeptide repeat protein [Elusimicrobiales bacterium]
MPSSTWVSSGEPQIRVSRTDQVMAFVKEKRESVIAASVVLLAAVILGTWFFLHYRQINDTAWKQLFIAQQTGFGGAYAESEKKLDEVAAGFARSDAAPYAVMSKGDILFRQEKYKEALEEYKKLLNGPAYMRPFALYNAGKSREAMALTAEAAADYRDFLARYADHMLAPEVHFSLAAVQEKLGDKEGAKASYEKIAILYPETSWSAAAKEKTGQAAPGSK